MEKVFKQTKGITLIALVITIIVLLILAGISISMLSGDNSILSRTTEAKTKTEEKSKEELIQLEVIGSIGEDGKIDVATLKTNLGKIGATVLENNLPLTGTLGGQKFTVATNGDVTIGDSVPTNPLSGGTTLKVGETDLKTVSNLSTLYGQETDYKSRYYPDIKWQLLYSDNNNYYVIASDYVPNAQLPCNENEGYGATDLLKVSGSDYAARFCSNSSYNDGVLTTGTIYKNGSSSTVFLSNPLTSTYLKWVNKYSTRTNNNICAVAFMLDSNKWKQFADGASGAYAIGGPTIEMLSLSWNAVDGHTKMTSYDTLSSSNSNTNGYLTNGPENGDNFLGTAESKWVTNMWFIGRDSTTGCSGYWLASPSGSNDSGVMTVTYNGYINWNIMNSSSYGYRPVVCIPK